MTALAARLLRVTYLRYLVASAVALGADLGCFLIFLHGGMPPTVASGAGYCIGIGVHWLLSSRGVFAAALADAGEARRRQAALFAASALAGLATTMLVTGLGTALHFDPRLARLIAVGFAFQLVWWLRRHLVFA